MQAGQKPRQAAHPVGEQHRSEAQFLEPGPHRQLMGGIGHGVEQGNGAAAQPLGPGLSQAMLQRGIALEGFHFAPIGGQAARHFQHPIGEQGRALHLQGEDVGAVLLADGGQIGETPIHQQQHRLHPPLQQGIGGHGGAEPHLRHQAFGQGLACRQAEHLADGGHRGSLSDRPHTLREHLAHHQGAIRGLAHQVGEGAAPVDPEPPAPRATLRTR